MLFQDINLERSLTNTTEIIVFDTSNVGSNFCVCVLDNLRFRESLRDLTSTLNAMDSSRYHMGITHKVPVSTFADANASRPWQIYHDLAMVLIDHARKIVWEQSDAEQATKSIYALDATTIDLCLSLFPWATFRTRKAAIKLHTLMNLEGSIPTFIHISEGRTHDVNVILPNNRTIG
jgi:hypothetical protein